MKKPYRIEKINAGIYLLHFRNGALVRLERYPDGFWNTFNENETRRGARDSYWQSYVTKRQAIAHLVEYADQLDL